MHDEFGPKTHAVLKAITDWTIGRDHNGDRQPEPEVIEPGGPGNANGPSGTSDYIILTARLEAGSVSITHTVEDGQGWRRQTRATRARFARLEMTLERSER